MAYNRDEEDRRDEDDGDDEIGETDYKSQKDAVLFAIEVSKSMLESPSEEESKDKDSAVTAALKSASLMMQQRIIAQPKDMMGLIFYGTEKTKFRGNTNSSSSQYPHCYVHTDLDIPSAEVVRTLKDMAENNDDPEGVLKPAGSDPPIRDMLFCANQIFTTGAPNFGSRRLFIVTDNDDPFSGDKKLREQAAVRAKDLFDLGVTIELFPISREGRKFDLDKFYSDIIYLDPLQVADPDAADEIKTIKSGDGISLLQSLTSSITAKQTPKRAYFSSMPFQLAPGMTISVNGYLIMHRQVAQRNCYVYIEDENAPTQLVKSETTKTEDGSMRTVEKTELKKAYKFGAGGDLIYFTPRELEQIKEFEPPCIRIIGFKPQSMLPSWAAIKKSIFIFPTEAGFVGSTRVFSALWQKLLDSKKMAIAWHIARKNALPQLVAILPSHKPSDEDSGTHYLPAGLWLFPLPFVDDRRDLEPIKQQPVVRASDELITQMRSIVQNLQLPKSKYDPSKYPNPALQYHYKVLQALALDEDIPGLKQEDHTLPRYRQINKRVGAYQAEFKEKLDEEAAIVRQEMAIKREAEEDADDRPKKRTKTAPKKAGAAGGTTLKDLNEAIMDGSLNKRTVVDLKAICTERGLSTSGKKADLLERIEQWTESQN